MLYDDVKNCKLKFDIDENGQEVLLRDGWNQVMMGWEKPWMEACVDALKPHGDVLEIGFGLGLSATQFQKYPIKTHTIVECHPTVIERMNQWGKSYQNVKIIEGMWQQSFDKFQKYDIIFFDDHSSIIDENKYSDMQMFQDQIRFKIFIFKCLDYFMKPGARACMFMNKSKSRKDFYTEVFAHRNDVVYREQWIEIKPPKNCNYYRENKVLIPIIEKIK